MYVCGFILSVPFRGVVCESGRFAWGSARAHTDLQKEKRSSFAKSIASKRCQRNVRLQPQLHLQTRCCADVLLNSSPVSQTAPVGSASPMRASWRTCFQRFLPRTETRPSSFRFRSYWTEPSNRHLVGLSIYFVFVFIYKNRPVHAKGCLFCRRPLPRGVGPSP